MIRFLFLLLLFCTLFASTTSATAQNEAACTAHVISAISQLSTQCATTGIDTACYGTHNATGMFVEETEPGVFTALTEQDFFLEPGDSVDLQMTQSLQTSPIDLDSAPPTFGLVLMNVQAGLPADIIEATEGKGALYFLFGDVIIEDTLQSRQGIELLPAGIPLETISAAELYIAPDSDDELDVVTQVPANSSVSADAITPDEAWVRIAHQNQLGWISRASLDSSSDLSELVVISPDDFMLMQSFFFDTDIQQDAAEADCELVPSVILIQGPADIPVYMQVNEVDVLLQSTLVLRRSRDRIGEYFDIITMSGLVTVFPHTDRQTFVPPGFFLRMRLGEVGYRGHPWWREFTGVDGSIRPLSREDLARFWFFPYIPRNILHYLKLLPRWIRASGIGEVIERIIFENPEALRYVRRLCERDRLPDHICDIFNL